MIIEQNSFDFATYSFRVKTQATLFSFAFQLGKIKMKKAFLGEQLFLS